ncbi:MULTISPECIES: spore germination protein [Bacillus]|uniref:spore germination protein n=1 Tax=Bacillus TaxID=1386 RepID=UPI001D0D5B17|nr:MULTISPECIES: spore germination protein [Bacillus]
MMKRRWLHKKYIFEEKRKLAKEQDKVASYFLYKLKKSNDFISSFNEFANTPYHIYYIDSLIDTDIIHRDILTYLNEKEYKTLEEVMQAIPIENSFITKNEAKIEDQLLNGHVAVQLNEEDEECLLLPAEKRKGRTVSLPEVEFSVVGPKEAFTESLNTNINLVRKRIPIPELEVKEFTVGKLSKTKVAVLSIHGIANQENVNTVIQRIEDIRFDQINDSSYITQLIQDNNNSPFPQFIDTERPDRIAAVLAEGKVVILADGAPHGLIGPTTLIEFFSAFEDYFLNWILASFFRIIRFLAVIFSILVTPIYVAVLTYHYELIPKDLVSTLVTSRSAIPLPPFLEAMILELAIELLREAGARLPTKVGQTIGIVGGIVIGTASVEAGLTSNVLLIIVALSALASFTTPVYQMGNTIRLIRFPFLLLAHIWGLLGVGICFCFLIIHLLRLTSLGRPFLEPVYPLRLPDLKDSFIRLPFQLQTKRPIETQSEETIRFENKEKKKLKDIDEYST